MSEVVFGVDYRQPGNYYLINSLRAKMQDCSLKSASVHRIADVRISLNDKLGQRANARIEDVAVGLEPRV